MDREKKGKLEQIRKKLYSRSGAPSARSRRKLPPDTHAVGTKWEHEHATPPKRSRKKRNPLTVIFVVSLVFFVGAAAAAALFFFGGSSTVSTKNIKIEVDGPTAVAGGDELSLQIAVTNNNSVPIELADLVVEYPEGTRSATDLNTELQRHRESLGTIKAGERVTRPVRAVLFGEENADKEITITVEYRVQNSNAIFFTERTYDVTLSSSPLSIAVDALDESVSGQEVELRLTVTSNATTVLEDVLVRADYPFGFSFQRASPEPAFASNVFALGDMPAGSERTITIRGELAGQDGEVRVFRFESGTASESDEKELAAAFITASHEFTVRRPFLATQLALNGDSSGNAYITKSGETIRGDVTVTNNLDTEVRDAEIRLQFSGTGFDRTSISSRNGFYQSNEQTIIWDRTTDSALEELAPGESRSLSFTFAPVGPSVAAGMRNPETTLAIAVKGTRLESDRVPEEVQARSERTVKLTSDLRLLGRAVHFVGPFGNTGPMPPQVGEETTYTIIWSVTNTANDLRDVVVSGTLPSYMRVTGSTFPADADITFSDVGGRVTWRVGRVEAGTGTTGSPREVAFQVALSPSTSQIGDQPPLILDQRIRGFDEFTDTEVTFTRPPLTTRLVNDPQFKSGEGVVAE